MNVPNHLLVYTEMLEQHGLLDDLYKAVSTLDGSAVLEAYKIMNISKSFPCELKHVKNYERSSAFRSQGNVFYHEQKYQEALEMYNKALLFAPKGSLELLHAYGNRSALFFHLSAFSASVKDIETCRTIGCTKELAKKLNKRYDQCQQVLWKEHLKNNLLQSNFWKDFFKFNVKKHPDIPCLSADVDIVSESGERKAVAAKDIKVGTVVTVETAFATHCLKDKSFLSCHHCQKMTLNLIPCENCCYALFCSDECIRQSLTEYHNIECQMTGILETVDTGYHLAIKSVLKLKNMCKNWSTFIKEANNIGARRLNESPLNEVYDVENYSSILCFKEHRRFLFGTFYNSCFLYALVLQHLERVEGFFPESKSEGLEAKKCFGKLCLSLQLNCITTELVTSAEALNAGRVVAHMPRYYGWFPFSGKLRHSCEPNLLMLGLDNKVALVAIRPIKKMTELTVSYVGHWYELAYDERRFNIYNFIRNVCRCRVCEGAWDFRRPLHTELDHLDHKQKKLYTVWQHMLNSTVMPYKDASFFRSTCAAMAALDELPNSESHIKLFTQLRTTLTLCQYAHTGNETIVNLGNAGVQLP